MLGLECHTGLNKNHREVGGLSMECEPHLPGWWPKQLETLGTWHIDAVKRNHFSTDGSWRGMLGAPGYIVFQWFGWMGKTWVPEDKSDAWILRIHPKMSQFLRKFLRVDVSSFFHVFFPCSSGNLTAEVALDSPWSCPLTSRFGPSERTRNPRPGQVNPCFHQGWHAHCATVTDFFLRLLRGVCKSWVANLSV